MKAKEGKKPMRQSEKTKWQSLVQTYCPTDKNEGHNDIQLQEMQFKCF